MTDPIMEATFGSESGAAWLPGPHHLERSRLAKLIARTGAADLSAFHARAVADPEWYWRQVVADLNLRFTHPFGRVLDQSRGAELPRWFTGGRINASETCLDQWLEDPDQTALIAVAEDGAPREFSYGWLHEQTVALASYLRRAGVRPGDCVGLFFPMIPEAAVALFACARVGAIAVPAYSAYGPDAVASRLQISSAKMLLCADGFTRKGRPVDLKDVVDRARGAVPTLEQVIVVAHLSAPVARTDHELSWDDALSDGRAHPEDGDAEQLDPNEPMLIVFTSGTSGAPKGIVLSHGGFLAKAAADWAYLFDVQEDDTVLWPSDLGWLMAPIMIVGTLALHARLVMLEGVPGHPTAAAYWRTISEVGVTLLGTSPTATRGLMHAGDAQLEGSDLSALRGFASVGEPWDQSSWMWLFETVGGGRHPILNYCGGTEISGGIVSCYTICPIAPGGFAGPVVGLDADVVGPDGESVRGQSGELVMRHLTPGVTHSFWHDDERYLETYWSQIPGLWVQGDEAIIDEHGHWYVIGRSDDTIKVAGRRIGPAEVEAAVLAHPLVAEAAVIGIPDDEKGSAISCFVVRIDGAPDDDALRAEIFEEVTQRLGKTLVPSELHFVSGLPRTRNGKLVRRAVRTRYLGLPSRDISALDDPAVLEAIPVLGDAEPTARVVGLA